MTKAKLNPSPKKQFITKDRILLTIAILGILIISIGSYAILNSGGGVTGSSTLDVDNKMRAGITITGDSVEVVNENNYDWKDVRVTLDGKYNCKIVKDSIAAGKSLSIDKSDCKDYFNRKPGDKIKQIAVESDKGAVGEFLF